MSTLLIQSFQVMGWGLAGVFSALAILYVCIKVLGKIFPVKADKE